MSRKIILTLVALAVDFVYRILDYLNEWSILYFIRSVCTQLDTIVDSSYRYQISLLVLYLKIQSLLCSRHYSCLRNGAHGLDLCLHM